MMIKLQPETQRGSINWKVLEGKGWPLLQQEGKTEYIFVEEQKGNWNGGLKMGGE